MPRWLLVIILLAILVLPVFYILSRRTSLITMPEIITPTGVTSPPGGNTSGLPLTLPPGLSVSVVADGLQGPRDLEWDPVLVLLVSEPEQGRVVTIPDRKIVASDLSRPHGLAFSGNRLYIAETNQVAVYDYDPELKTASNRKKIIDLPGGGGHFTRSLLIKDNQLYVSIGSSCNVCRETDPRRAAVYISNLDGTNFRPLSTGLRNSVFLISHPKKDEIWATDMGRDWLGNDLPPDEVNILKAGDYGWPNCYGKNVPDRNFSPDIPSGKCTYPSFIDLPAHSAPLGLAVIPDTWPVEYRGDLLIAYHGSWNRQPPTGYKLVRVEISPQGTPGQIHDFVSGWLNGQEVLGRPVDLIFDPDGNLFLSDDKKGVVYRFSWQPGYN